MTPYQASNYTVDANGCWNWAGTITRDGYGRLGHEGRQQLAHRVFYETFVGPIPEGLTIDHLCRNRRCVRPDPAHLEPVTQKVNVLRGTGIAAVNARKTHCKNGHEYTPENLTRRTRGRQCRTCQNQWVRDYRQRRRMAAANIQERAA